MEQAQVRAAPGAARGNGAGPSAPRVRARAARPGRALLTRGGAGQGHLIDAVRHDHLEPQHRLDLGQTLSALGRHAEEQEVYAKLLQELGPNALAYSYMASSILAQYQVTIGHRSYGKVRRPAPALLLLLASTFCAPRELTIISPSRLVLTSAI